MEHEIAYHHSGLWKYDSAPSSPKDCLAWKEHLRDNNNNSNYLRSIIEKIAMDIIINKSYSNYKDSYYFRFASDHLLSLNSSEMIFLYRKTENLCHLISKTIIKEKINIPIYCIPQHNVHEIKANSIDYYNSENEIMNQLTDTQKIYAYCVAQGFSSREIAEITTKSIRTVECNLVKLKETFSMPTKVMLEYYLKSIF